MPLRAFPEAAASPVCHKPSLESDLVAMFKMLPKPIPGFGNSDCAAGETEPPNMSC